MSAWITTHPPVTADIDSCVTCGLCLPSCPTFRLTGDESASPRGRLAAIGAVAEGIVPVDGRFDEITSFCLQCRACETACPSMVPYGEIIESARGEAVAQLGSTRFVDRLAIGRVLRSRIALRLLTSIAALLQRLGFLEHIPSVGPLTSGLRPLPIAPPSLRGAAWGPRDGPSITLFTGCVADVWFADVHKAAIEVLTAAGYRVDARASQTCCGALAAHAGLVDDAQRMASANIEGLRGSDTVAVDVAGCGAHLKSYGRFSDDGAGLASRVFDITELVAGAIDDGRLPTIAPRGEIVAVQDPCHLEHGQKIVAQPRSILVAAGYTAVDADPGGLCCGAAGVYQLQHGDTGRELGERKAAAVVDTGATIVSSANAGCEMQLRRFLGSGFEVVHPVELYARALREL